MSGYPTVSFLEIDGKVLSGEEFEEYCKDHGLCRRCARVRTHRRVLKLLGRGKKWEPMTLHDEESGEYTVYKGYCLQPTCYTLGQAKRLLGESSSGRKSAKMRRHRLAEKLRAQRKRPSKRKTKTDPDTGSVIDASDDVSISSDMSGLSQMSGVSAISGMSGMSGFSGIGWRSKRSSKRSSTVSSSSSVSSLDDDDMTVDSQSMGMGAPPQEIEAGKPSPIVAHRVEQLAMYDYFTVLDLSKVELRTEDIDAIVQALGTTSTLESLTMDKCKIKDEGLEKVCGGLKKGNHTRLKKLSLSKNGVGNKGVAHLDFLLEQSPTLEELDLSENAISSRGASTILAALSKNTSIVLHTLNLSQNEIWDMDDGNFLRHNTTLKVLNLDGNFMHDEGAEQIASAIAVNKQTKIEKLYLGWNGISDDGATALAKMMESNNTLEVLGLAENDISNTGARAILSALAVNTSVREISGLYHNQIDRKFIIVAIKRLLHRYGERTGQAVSDDIDASLRRLEEEKAADPKAKAAIPTRKDAEAKFGGSERSGGSHRSGGSQKSEDGSVNWASQLYSAEEKPDSDEESPPQKRKSSVALEAIEHWDWGTFGIEEIENAGPNEDEYEEEAKQVVADEPPPPMTDFGMDRITVFQSAPLAYFNRETTEHHEVPLLDFEYELDELRAALVDSDELGAEIELTLESATKDQVSTFFSKGYSPIMHFSGHGHPDCLPLENGFGYMQALAPEDLRRFVATCKNAVRVVFVSSCHAESTANAFLKAGIKHVVCCQREAVFRDEGPVEFARVFYRSLAQRKTLKEAFHMALDGVKRSALIQNSRNINDRYKLLPEKGNHDIEVFFQNPPPDLPEEYEGDTSMLPKLPEQFVGREVDMYEILESLRVDDVVRVGGPLGCGKQSVVSAVSRYILDRPKSFGIGSVFWLPPPEGVDPGEDTLYSDFVQVVNWLISSEDDIWDETDYQDCRERIMLELEDQRTVLVIDGRVFESEAAGENLEKFLTHLLNEASVKIILLTAHDGTGSSSTKRSRSEETMIALGPLDFKASALLFGNACKHISHTGIPIVHTAEEFADFLVPPSVKRQGADQKVLSRRQEDLYERMGKGNPKTIIETASNLSEDALMEMLRFAQRPEVQVTSAEALKAEIAKRTAQKEKAITGKNFLRAQDLVLTLEELETLRSKYPSLEDLQNKEKDMKKQFSELLKARKYDEANAVKRQILALKKDMMKEKFSNSKPAAFQASNKLKELQEKMDTMLAMAEKLKLENENQGFDSDSGQASFVIARSGEDPDCILNICTGSIVDFNYPDGLSGIVCWTNENVDISLCDDGKKLLDYGGPTLKEELDFLPVITETSWGPVKCATGESVMIGPRSFAKLISRFVVFAVNPLSPSNDDTEWDSDVDDDALHYLQTAVRASYRSSFRIINTTGIQAMAIPSITTKEGGATYQVSLRVGLQTLIEESKFTKLSSLNLMASSAKEAALMIKMLMTMGLRPKDA